MESFLWLVTEGVVRDLGLENDLVNHCWLKDGGDHMARNARLLCYRTKLRAFPAHQPAGCAPIRNWHLPTIGGELGSRDISRTLRSEVWLLDFSPWPLCRDHSQVSVQTSDHRTERNGYDFKLQVCGHLFCSSRELKHVNRHTLFYKFEGNLGMGSTDRKCTVWLRWINAYALIEIKKIPNTPEFPHALLISPHPRSSCCLISVTTASSACVIRISGNRNQDSVYCLVSGSFTPHPGYLFCYCYICSGSFYCWCIPSQGCIRFFPLHLLCVDRHLSYF